MLRGFFLGLGVPSWQQTCCGIEFDLKKQNQNLCKKDR